MFRRTALGAAAVLTTGLMALGCGSDGDTIQTFVVPSAFPGTPVSQSFVGDDGRSLSNSGEDVDEAAWFPNVSNNTGLLFYRTDNNRLMGTFYDGSRFSRPARITAQNYDPADFVSVDDIQVVFVNRAGAGPGRAVIGLIWKELGVADDDQDAGSVDDNNKGNDRFMMVLHEAGQFSVGQPVDEDTRDTNTDSDEDVLEIMLVSDSRVYSYGTEGANASGQATSALFMTWVANDGATTDEETTYYAKELDLDTGLLGTLQEIADGGDAGADVVLQAAHNFTVFFTVADDDGNVMLRYVQLNQGLASAQISRDDGAANGLATVTIDQFGSETLFGADHGLELTEGFFRESGFGDDTDVGNDSVEDTDVMYFMVSTTSAAAAANVSVAEIDAYTGNADVADHDADATNLEVRLTRDRDGLMAVWLQASDADPSVDRQVIPIGTVVLTNVAGTAAADITAIADRLTNTVELSDLTDPTDTLGAAFEFQAGLADGTQGPECNIQSNPNRGYILVEQTTNRDPDPADSTEVLYVAGLEAATTGGTTTVTRIALRDIATIRHDWLNNTDVENNAAGVWSFGTWGIETAEAFDNGNGDVGVVYVHQGVEATTDIVTNSDDDFTYPNVLLHTGESGQTVQIGSHAPAGTLNGRAAAIQQPQFTVLGVSPFTGSNPNGGGNMVVFVFEEAEFTVGDNTVIRSRSWDTGAANSASPPTLENQFFPPLGTVAAGTRTEGNLPARVDTGSESDAEILLIAPVDGRAHLYFTQGSHLWWNDTAGQDWRLSGGASDPQQLDNHYRDGVEDLVFIGLQNGTDGRCDTDLILGYTKEVDEDEGNNSLLVRDAR